MKMTLNGKPFRPGDFEKALRRAAAEAVAKQMRERISSIRDPETGAFATVIVQGASLDDMSFRVEGTPELLERVKVQMSDEDLQTMQFEATDAKKQPKAFFSFGWEDRDFAERIATALQANGIDTWWAEWEIHAGDSIRRKIDAGLGDCSHFIVLLTPTSLNRPWVNEEIDAGFVQKVSRGAKFIALRHDVSPAALPPLLAGSLSPEIDTDLFNLQQLINDIHGVARKPALGPAPKVVQKPKTGYSSAATAIAEFLVKSSLHGQLADPSSTIEKLIEETGLTREDVVDALHELRHYFKVQGNHIAPQETLYAEFDAHWKTWVPADDALRLAADIVNDPEFPSSPGKIAERYGWEPRRLNPAIAYLAEREAVRVLRALASGPFNTVSVLGTDATRRFLKSRI